jgi:hypothetical protein
MSKVNQLLKDIAKKKAGFSFASVMKVLKGKKDILLPSGHEFRANNLIVAPIRTESVDIESLKQEVRDLAYQLWEKAGRPEGDGSYFWNEAEKELFGPDPIKDGGYYVYIQKKDGSMNLQLIK